MGRVSNFSNETLNPNLHYIFPVDHCSSSSSLDSIYFGIIIIDTHPKFLVLTVCSSCSPDLLPSSAVLLISFFLFTHQPYSSLMLQNIDNLIINHNNKNSVAIMLYKNGFSRGAYYKFVTVKIDIFQRCNSDHNSMCQGPQLLHVIYNTGFLIWMCNYGYQLACKCKWFSQKLITFSTFS